MGQEEGGVVRGWDMRSGVVREWDKRRSGIVKGWDMRSGVVKGCVCGLIYVHTMQR